MFEMFLEIWKDCLGLFLGGDGCLVVCVCVYMFFLQDNSF